MLPNTIKISAAVLAFVTLSACPGSKNTVIGGGGSTPKFNINGSVTGLPNGTSLNLSTNGTTVASDANGNFSFTGLTSLTEYDITVPTQPNGYNCTVKNGKGIISADVTNVIVTCAPVYLISGTATLPNGVTGVQFTVESTKHASETIPATANFSFATKFSAGDDYKVTVSAPANLDCTVTNKSGTISGNVTNVTVTCVPITYTIGGTVSGLTSGLFDTAQLELNGGESFYKRNGSFTFTTKLATGENYTVSIPSQGNSTCKITGGTGTIATDGLSITGTMGSADISDIAVTCTQP